LAAGRPSQLPADSHAAYYKHCSAGDCALHRMECWLQQLGEVGRGVVPYWDTLARVPSETIGVLSHRPIVLTDTIDYWTIGFSHNRPNPNNV